MHEYIPPTPRVRSGAHLQVLLSGIAKRAHRQEAMTAQMPVVEQQLPLWELKFPVSEFPGAVKAESGVPELHQIVPQDFPQMPR